MKLYQTRSRIWLNNRGITSLERTAMAASLLRRAAEAALGYTHMRLELSFLIIFTTTACVHRGSPPKLEDKSEPVNLTSASEGELKQWVRRLSYEVNSPSEGRSVLLFWWAVGRFTLFQMALSRGVRYEIMEGLVRVVGTLPLLTMRNEVKRHCRSLTHLTTSILRRRQRRLS